MNKDPDFGELPALCPLNEDNPVKDAAKFRKLTHERSDPEWSQRFPCWGRTFVDGYGGGQSMGEASYEGAIGGYLFRAHQPVKLTTNCTHRMSSFLRPSSNFSLMLREKEIVATSFTWTRSR